MKIKLVFQTYIKENFNYSDYFQTKLDELDNLSVKYTSLPVETLNQQIFLENLEDYRKLGCTTMKEGDQFYCFIKQMRVMISTEDPINDFEGLIDLYQDKAISIELIKQLGETQ